MPASVQFLKTMMVELFAQSVKLGIELVETKKLSMPQPEEKTLSNLDTDSGLRLVFRFSTPGRPCGGKR